jgi:hypothetical protein
MPARFSRGAFARLAALAPLAAVAAHAADAPAAAHRCADVADMRAKVDEGAGGRWIELTELQRAFLAGIYALDPATPPGLPLGDKAALARISGGSGWAVWFIDGARACDPIPAPEELVDMIRRVGAGEVAHEGHGT